MQTEYKIIIYKGETKFWRYLREGLGVVLGVVLPTSLGVVTGSVAMQWAGFFFGVVIILAVSDRIYRKSHFTSVKEARAYLDRIERGEA